MLDEFPYLCEASKGLPSEIQRFWDTRGKNSRLMLVLCGSQVSFMEKEVLAERSPLFGRRTGAAAGSSRSRRRDALRVLPALGACAIACSPTRSSAACRRTCGASTTRARCARTCCASACGPEGYLFDEVQFLLRSELSNPATYNCILAAVARGIEKRRRHRARRRRRLDRRPTSTCTTLRELRLVEREVPLTDPDPLRSRRGTYRIADRFLAFHFRHIQPHVSLIHAGRGGRVLEEFDRARLRAAATTTRASTSCSSTCAREAAELIGEEIVETGRHRGHVRARRRAHGARRRRRGDRDPRTREPGRARSRRSSRELGARARRREVDDARLRVDRRSGERCRSRSSASPASGAPLMPIDERFQEYFAALDRAGNQDHCYLCRRTPAEVKRFFGFDEDGVPLDARRATAWRTSCSSRRDIMSYRGDATGVRGVPAQLRRDLPARRARRAAILLREM